MNRVRWKRVLGPALALMLALTGCGSMGIPASFLPGGEGSVTVPAPAPVVKETPVPIGEVHLRDKALLYGVYDPTSVAVMYLTVSEGNASDATDHTWEEINTFSAYDYDEWGVERYKVNGLLQAGDETGPLPGELGFGQTTPNATVQIRGQTSSRYSQKNYKIKLRDNQGAWRDQQTIAVNKHMADGLRFRNKLGFDLISEVPQIMGLRTQFVHLYVKDLTASGDGEDAVFEDYGLYTQVEQLNKRALRAHGLDRNGHLYKINTMEFYEYPEIVLMDDPSYDEAAFNLLLECKGSMDHTKLIQMLHVVNDPTIPSEELLTTYFDSENIAYWMAFMILTGNTDTQNRNFYLYSPLQSKRWYILPWDNDALLTRTEDELRGYVDRGSWEAGVSNYWGNMLFRRALQSESFRQELDQAVEELRAGVLSREHLEEKLALYAPVAEPYIRRMPDAMYAKLTEEEYQKVLAGIPGEVDENYEAYKESLEKPLPFFVGTPEPDGENLHLTWEVAYDFDAEDITYEAVLAKDCDFNEVLWHEEGLRVNEATAPMQEPGQYFLRVRAKNKSGYEQDCFDYYVRQENGKVFGAFCFYILPDGTVEVEELVE